MKPWLEILALLVGLVLGGVSLYQQLKPTQALTADILNTRCPLPPVFAEGVRALPERLSAVLTEPPEKGTPAVPELKAAAPKVKALAERQIEALFWLVPVTDDLFVCTITNNGDVPLEAVQLSFRYAPPTTFVVEGPDGKRRTEKATGLLELGELRPQAKVQVFAWGLGTSLLFSPNILLSHKGGKGEVREVRPVPPLVASGGGIWFSYRAAFYLILSLMLVAVAAIGFRKTLVLIRTRKESRDA